jgi:acetyl esterase
LRDDARAYADRLAEAGVDVTFHEYSGQIHVFLNLTKVVPDGLRATREIADYVKRKFAI